uniref:CobW/HypB/UreG nucleotide-binding domain-containing protein n=1 Tax=Mucochytrium quahogii TaxID=96639 RepID=A0A7S2S5C3_9STRA
MGAAGRDFHNFNTVYRDNEEFDVVAFTATQIPDIDDKCYPSALAGKLYPNGIPICPEAKLGDLIRDNKVDDVVFAYSDTPHEYVMHKASEVMAAGASFRILGPNDTMIKSKVPVIAIVSSRTGAGKSQTTRRVVEELAKWGKKVVCIRHPMPYGDLVAQKVQRFASVDDLKKHNCTIEEMEEYEPHVAKGNVIYAGVDYGAIMEQAQEEADIILWDGGNNDFPFYKADLYITVVDPLRPGNEVNYHPGEVNLRMADVVVINKMDSASPDDTETVRKNIAAVNPKAVVIDAASPIFCEDPSVIRGKRVLVVEDGPTLTHGEMKYGAGIVAARKFGACEIVDPRPFTVGKISFTYKKYPKIGCLLPAMGYGEEQTRDLEQTIENADCDAVIIATPIDLRRIIKISKPSVRVTYELEEIGVPKLVQVLEKFK